MLYRSSLDFSLLHPGSLTDDRDASIERIQRRLPNDVPKAWLMAPGSISRSQVAAFMLEELATPQWLRKTVALYN